jgi:hypothetical protein
LTLLLLSGKKVDEEKSEGHSFSNAQARTSEDVKAWGDVTLSDCKCFLNSQLTLDSDRVKRTAAKRPTSRLPEVRRGILTMLQLSSVTAKHMCHECFLFHKTCLLLPT